MVTEITLLACSGVSDIAFLAMLGVTQLSFIPQSLQRTFVNLRTFLEEAKFYFQLTNSLRFSSGIESREMRSLAS